MKRRNAESQPFFILLSAVKNFKILFICLIEIFENGKVFFATLAYASEVVIQSDETGIEKDAVSTVIHQAVIYMPFAELVDIAEEKARLEKEVDKLHKEIARASGMLNNPNFVSKAPEAKIQAERDKLEKYTQMLKQVEERLEALKG